MQAEPYHAHDVLCGRGRKTYEHRGNYAFRSLVKVNKNLYASSRKIDKINVSKNIVLTIQSQDPPGRFLEYDNDSRIWKEISDSRAIEKTSQALRERRITSQTDSLIPTVTLTDFSEEDYIQMSSGSYRSRIESKKLDYASKDILSKTFSSMDKKCVQAPQTNSFNSAILNSTLLFEKSLHESCKDVGINEDELNSLIYNTFAPEECSRKRKSYDLYDSEPDVVHSDTAHSRNFPPLPLPHFNRDGLALQGESKFTLDHILSKDPSNDCHLPDACTSRDVSPEFIQSNNCAA